MNSSEAYLKWNREEFIAYVMSYAARIDVDHSVEERRMIRDYCSFSNYQSIQKEIKKDSDIEALHKIEAYARHHELTLLDQDLVLTEVRKMFEFNEEHSAMEEGILAMLKKLFP
ncbi:hypothetical protein [Nonlabens marinus]|uniref:Uncharacterized protein n=1 Tax=Nonlabens marinus S1-08 TaxID=1454201 RepID=W8VZ87_9FLAO|nr:hypothetical protein [Nonlabens marinus]BAO54146.1 hypothetical protein NMS_0137 [Nonlabens marinus S1-08]